MPSRRVSFEQFIREDRIIIFDGAMGTQLEVLGLPMSGEVNLSHPEKVRQIHSSYLDSGAQILISNTLTMNRHFIEAHELRINVEEVNLAGVEAARSPGEDHYVLGDISSTGTLLEPYGNLPEREALAVFREQAEVLDRAGVDGFIIETMYDLKEALLALDACKQISDLPILATIAFNSPKDGGRTIMGDSALDCARQLEGAGAFAVGANCGDLSPFQVADVIAEMRAVTDLPLIAQPNAGSPQIVEGNTVFKMAPDEFTAGIHNCIEAGARLVGGCCGTTPDHIHSISMHIQSKWRE
jgi:5-methyltetrahydrofolate--homocysteine methyltransferase